jgi:hypothetical protein
MADTRRSGWPAKVIVLLVVIAILRANLPPNSVAQSLDLGRLEDTAGLKGFLGRLAAKSIASEVVADWEYTDLVIVKLAYSKRLDLIAIGLPFCKWKVHDAKD